MATATTERKTELVKQPSPFSAPIKFEVSMEQIKQLAAEYMPLAIVDVNDKAQLEKVHTARMDVVRLIRGIEKGGKEMRDEANKFAKNVIAAERTFTTPLIQIRDHLANEENKVKLEAERIAREAAEARQAKTRERLAMLQACGKSYMEADIADLPDDEFEELHKAELADKLRRDDEAAAQAAEAARIAEQQRLEALELAKQHKELEIKRVEAEARSKRMQASLELLARTGFAHSYTGDELADMESAAWELVLDDARKDKATRDRAAADEKARSDRRASRICALGNLGYAHTLTGDELADMPAASWESLLDGARKEKAARDKAAADQQAALDKQREEQEAAQAKIDAEKKRIHDARCAELIKYEFPGQRYELAADISDVEYSRLVNDARARRDQYDSEQKALLEKTAADAAEKAKQEAIAEQERVAAAEKAHAEAAAAEQQRMDALRPDHEKLLAYADAIAAVPIPEVSYHATSAASEAEATVGECVAVIRTICSDMIKAA